MGGTDEVRGTLLVPSLSNRWRGLTHVCVNESRALGTGGSPVPFMF